jgi:hypothetical protein
MRVAHGAWICWAVAAAGCSVPLPTYEWQGVEPALRTMADRAASARDVSAQCQILLTDAEGQSVTLDGAMIASGDNHLRLRAWKLNRAILDITLNDRGLFIWSESDDGSDRTVRVPGHVVQAWSLLSGTIFSRAPDKVVDLGGPTFDVHFAANGTLVAEVDRRTLTVQRYLFADRRLVVRQVLRLQDYELVEGIPWPMQVRAEGEQGSVMVRMHSVELGAELPPGAFEPAAGAVKQDE